MANTYMIRIKTEYKDWIARKSAIEGTPIYIIFEKLMFSYFKENYTENSIEKIQLPDDNSKIGLSYTFGKTLKLEALDKQTNIISLINKIFEFYLMSKENKI